MLGRLSCSLLASPHFLPWPLRPLDEMVSKVSCRLKILIFNLLGIVRINNAQSAQDNFEQCFCHIFHGNTQ